MAILQQYTPDEVTPYLVQVNYGNDIVFYRISPSINLGIFSGKLICIFKPKINKPCKPH